MTEHRLVSILIKTRRKRPVKDDVKWANTSSSSSSSLILCLCWENFLMNMSQLRCHFDERSKRNEISTGIISSDFLFFPFIISRKRKASLWKQSTHTSFFSSFERFPLIDKRRKFTLKTMLFNDQIAEKRQLRNSKRSLTLSIQMHSIVFNLWSSFLCWYRSLRRFPI